MQSLDFIWVHLYKVMKFKTKLTKVSMMSFEL